jgi:hypothetical protein
LLFSISINSVGQNNQSFQDPFTFNAASGLYGNMFEVVDWNFGEVLAYSLTDNQKLLITTGFLQSKEIQKVLLPSLDSLLALDKDNSLLSIFPNPVSNQLFVKNNHPLFKITEMNLYNIKGDLVKIMEEPFSTPIFNKNIQLSNLSNGVYVLLVKYIINQKYYRAKLFKVVKQ